MPRSRPTTSRRRSPIGTLHDLVVPSGDLRPAHRRTTADPTGSTTANGAPDVVEGVLGELGFRWTEDRTRRRRIWAAAASSGVMLCLAIVAGSGLILGDVRSGGPLGAAIGRLGIDLRNGFAIETSPDALVERFAPAGLGNVSPASPEERNTEARWPSPPEPRDPTRGILATAPWHPV